MKRFIIIVSVLVLLSLSASQCGPIPPPTGSCGDNSQPYWDGNWVVTKTWTYCSNDDIDGMYDEINDWRRAEELGELSSDLQVMDVASYWSTYLACANKRGHEVLAEDGTTVLLNHSQRVRDIGANYAGALVYENVAYQRNLDVEEAFNGWITSDNPTHQQNIENPDVTSVGVGCVHIDPANNSRNPRTGTMHTFEYYWTVKFIDR